MIPALLIFGALALIILPIIWSAIPTKKRATEDMTVFGSPRTDYKAETLSVDFPDTTTGEICSNVGTLFEIHIHVPTHSAHIVAMCFCTSLAIAAMSAESFSKAELGWLF